MERDRQSVGPAQHLIEAPDIDGARRRQCAEHQALRARVAHHGYGLADLLHVLVGVDERAVVRAQHHHLRQLALTRDAVHQARRGCQAATIDVADDLDAIRSAGLRTQRVVDIQHDDLEPQWSGVAGRLRLSGRHLSTRP